MRTSVPVPPSDNQKNNEAMLPRPCFPRPCLCLCLLAALAVAPAASAAEWEVLKTLGLTEAYSDNILIDRPGLEEDEWVTRVSPRIQAEATGARGFEASIDYALEALAYQSDSSRNQIFNRLDANARVPLAADVFAVDLYGTVAQQIVDPSAELPFTLLSGTTNLTDVSTVGVAPVVQVEFGDGAAFTARYIAAHNDWDLAEIPDADSRGGLLSLGNSTGTSVLIWGVYLVGEHVDFDTGTMFDLESAQLEFGARLAPQTFLSFRAGREEFQFRSVLQQSDVDDEVWYVGIVRDLGERSQFEMRVGERFFGDTAVFNFERRSDRINVRITYREEPATYALQSDFGELLDFDGTASLELAPIERFVDQFFINERADFELSREGRRTEYGIGAYDEERLFVDTGQSDVTTGALAYWRWRFGARSRLIIDVFDDEISVLGAESTARKRVELGFEKVLSGGTQLEVAVARTRQEGGDAMFEYEENSFLVSAWFNLGARR
jgi:hypothetical protein